MSVPDTPTVETHAPAHGEAEAHVARNYHPLPVTIASAEGV